MTKTWFTQVRDEYGAEGSPIMRPSEYLCVVIDIKPDNILVKYNNQGLTQYKLSDLGDSARADVRSNNGEHIIGPAIFRAPEVSLGVPWTTKADIWALGATVNRLTSQLIENARTANLVPRVSPC